MNGIEGHGSRRAPLELEIIIFMRTTIIVLTFIIFGLTGCNTMKPANSETATANPAVSANTITGSLFAIDEIGLGPEGYVALTNITDQAASLGGLFLCQGTQCFALPDVEVAPRATVRVAAGSTGPVAAQFAFGELQPADGEIALAASNNLQDPKALLAYLEWGATPHADTEVAIKAGLWIKGSYAPSASNATRLFHQEGGLWLFDTK